MKEPVGVFCPRCSHVSPAPSMMAEHLRSEHAAGPEEVALLLSLMPDLGGAAATAVATASAMTAAAPRQGSSCSPSPASSSSSSSSSSTGPSSNTSSSSPSSASRKPGKKASKRSRLKGFLKGMFYRESRLRVVSSLDLQALAAAAAASGSGPGESPPASTSSSSTTTTITITTTSAADGLEEDWEFVESSPLVGTAGPPRSVSGPDLLTLEEEAEWTVVSEPALTAGFLDGQAYASLLRTPGRPRAATRTEAWQSVEVPESLGQQQQQQSTAWLGHELLWLIRRGIPAEFRREIWLSCAQVSLAEAEATYQRQFADVYGAQAPKKHYVVPLFGSSLPIGCLTEQGWLAAKRLLCIISFHMPMLHFCPQLPRLIVLALHFLQEDEAHGLALALVRQAKHARALLSADGNTPTDWDRKVLEDITQLSLLAVNKQQVLFKTVALESLIIKQLPELHAQMKSLGITVKEAVFDWFATFFDTLPLPTSFRLMDVALNEGAEAELRIALALLQGAEHALSQCSTRMQWLASLSGHVASCLDVDALFKTAFGLTLRDLNSKRLAAMARTARDTGKLESSSSSLNLAEHSGPYFRPKLSQPSHIISEDHLEFLWAHIPERYRLYDPDLAFCLRRSGVSWTTLCAAVNRSQPLIFILQARNEMVFGVFLAKGIPEQRVMVSDGEAFAFRLEPEAGHWAWAQGRQDWAACLDVSSLALGPGDDSAAISIDKELEKGMCGSSPAFQCPELSGSAFFDIKALEVYTLVCDFQQPGFCRMALLVYHQR